MRQRRAVPKPEGFSDSVVPTLLQSKGYACGLLGNLHQLGKARMKLKHCEFIFNGLKSLPLRLEITPQSKVILRVT